MMLNPQCIEYSVSTSNLGLSLANLLSSFCQYLCLLCLPSEMFIR